MAAGFVGFEITWRKDVFSDAPQAGSAANFGTLGINFRARKAVNEEEWKEEWTAAMAALSCEVPAQRSVEAPAEKLAVREVIKRRPRASTLPLAEPQDKRPMAPLQCLWHHTGRGSALGKGGETNG